MFEAVIVVDVPTDVQLARMLSDRGWTREDAESRIAAQASREDRRAIPTYVLDNPGSPAALPVRVPWVDGEPGAWTRGPRGGYGDARGA